MAASRSNGAEVMVSDNACMDVYTNQPLEWPTCQSPATVPVNEIVNEGGYKLLWERPFGIAVK
jgi:hypothetical protein